MTVALAMAICTARASRFGKHIGMLGGEPSLYALGQIGGQLTQLLDLGVAGNPRGSVDGFTTRRAEPLQRCGDDSVRINSQAERFYGAVVRSAAF